MESKNEKRDGEEEEDEEEEEGPKLTKEQLAEIKVAFKMFDREGTGTVTSKEFTHVLRSIGLNTTEAELNDMIAEIDEDGNGNVEIEEFEEMMRSKLRDEDLEEELRDTFAVFDRDNSGAIDPDELYESMIKLGQRCTREDAVAMIREVDKNGDGVINFEEFCEMVIGRPPKKDNNEENDGQSIKESQEQQQPEPQEGAS